MKVLKTLAALPLGLLLTFASLPWVCWALGRSMFGDEAGFDRAMAACPLVRYYDWVSARAD